MSYSYILEFKNIFEEGVESHVMVFKSLKCNDTLQTHATNSMISDVHKTDHDKHMKMYNVLYEVRKNFDWRWIATIIHISDDCNQPECQMFSRYVYCNGFWLFLDQTNYPIKYKGRIIMCTKELSKELNILNLQSITPYYYIKYIDSIKPKEYKWPNIFNPYFHI